ncbi:aminotransferase class V-fold PLP-dependent enzyme [Shimazuella sp. AN120528]|uniref:aminotransferase class V-fold PLP-dependent enzyme n=1 Tax=Shimazuella soli TaxID=1892854 RepID=UPI001F0FD1E1|nr:aminotransferase class V-fold PLP-dependent enzyme [Shimazuella soli]
MVEKRIFYFDQAATSFPKPDTCIEEVNHFLSSQIGTIRRRGYTSRKTADNIVEKARSLLLSFINGSSQDRLIFTLNATEAINMALQGYLQEGDHVITSPYEHSAVSRTLVALSKTRKIEYTVVQPNEFGVITTTEVERYIQPNTKLIAFCHASNVTGNIIVADDIGAFAKTCGIAYFLDASQSIGSCHIDVAKLQPQFMAFSGHKSLLGPTGVGCLYMKEGTLLPVFRYGGTGYHSSSDWSFPETANDYETGTQNVVGIVGLLASLEFIQEKGLQSIIQHKLDLADYFLAQIQNNTSITVYGNETTKRLPIVSFNIKNMSPVTEVATLLDNSFHIVTRAGLHCSPWAHRYIGTYPSGTVRVSFGAFHTKSDINYLLESIQTIIMMEEIS